MWDCRGALSSLASSSPVHLIKGTSGGTEEFFSKGPTSKDPALREGYPSEKGSSLTRKRDYDGLLP